MGWAERVVAAAVAASVASWPAPASTAPLRIESLAVRRATGSVAVLVQTDRPYQPRVTSGGVPHGDRIYLDFPPGTEVAPRVPTRIAGTGPVEGVAVGPAADRTVRVAIDVAPGARFAVRRPPDGDAVAIVVAAPPEAAAPNPGGRTALPRPGPRALRVAIDPGHGGDDPGATGRAREKDVTLDIARELAALLRAGLRAEVTLTRTGDESVSLPERTRRANVARADLFISIHANASGRRAARGIETYYLDNTEDQATLRLASIENGGAGEPGRGTDLDYILSSLVQAGKQVPSIRLAERVQAGLIGRLRAEWGGIVDLGVKRGPFYVLVGAYMPCILVEASFLTNPEEGRRMADPTYRRAVAEGIYRGVVAFLQSNEMEDTL